MIPYERLLSARPVLLWALERQWNAETARSNGLDSAAVGYGFGSFAELNAEAPTWHFETLAEMHQAFLPRA